MVDLYGKDKGNISLPVRLHPPDIWDEDLDDAEFKILIMNMQKALYNVRIADIRKRIKRLENRNSEVLDACETTEIFYSHTDVETQDGIAQLNRQLFVETEKIEECKKRVDIVEKWRAEEKQAHLKKVESITKRYTKTHLALTSDIKALNAKINTLEDYKMTRNSLRDKLKAGDDIMAQREEEIKKKLEKIERKFKIDREKLKKEMYKRLLGLAGTFQIEVAGCIAKPIHRLMRENIVMKNELTQIVKESIVKKERGSKKHGTLNEYRKGIKVGHIDTVEHLITIKIQRHLLKTVSEEHAKLEKYLAALPVPPGRLEAAEALYNKYKEESTQSMMHVTRLETLLHQEQTRLGFAKHLKKKSAAEVKRCMDTLYDAKYAVACALRMTCTGEDVAEMGDTQLMSYLLDILLRGDTKKWTVGITSVESVPEAKEAYIIGDLGFDPEHISMEIPKGVLKKEPSELSTFAILRALGTRLSQEVDERNRSWEVLSIEADEEFKEEEGSEVSMSVMSRTGEGEGVEQHKEDELHEEEEMAFDENDEENMELVDEMEEDENEEEEKKSPSPNEEVLQ